MPAQGGGAGLPGRAVPPLLVDHLPLVSGEGPPHRAGTNGNPPDVGGEGNALGLAVAVVDHEIERVLPGVDHLGVERLACPDAMPEIREAVAREVLLDEQTVLRRRRAEGRDLVAREEREMALRIETPVAPER